MTNLSAGPGLIAAAALLFAAGGALAADALPSDAPVATATGPARSVSEQIDEYLRSSPAASLPKDRAPGVIPNQEEYERQIHGEVSVAIGTGGYRSAYVRSDLPIGKTGTLSVALSETKGRGYGGYGYGGYGYDGFGGYGPGGYGMGGYGYGGDSRSLGVALTLPGGAGAARSLGPDGREYATGCGRGVGERRIAGVNELVVEPGRGRCVERWMGDPLDR